MQLIRAIDRACGGAVGVRSLQIRRVTRASAWASRPDKIDHAHLALGGGHPSKVNNTFGGRCLDPQQFVHIL
eukprot:scaffold46337_cov62-Phaeocystis_antarctica.AAC.4